MSFAFIAISSLCAVLVAIWSMFKRMWLNPKRLERCLRGQGFRGNPYKFLIGDGREEARMGIEARSRPMPGFTNDYLSRIHPFYHQSLKIYGGKSFVWKGPVPFVNIDEPEMVRNVLMNMHKIKKNHGYNVVKMILNGLGQLEGEEWAHHRKILNPAFRMDKLKVMVPVLLASSNEMLDKWEAICGTTGSSEVDVWPYMRVLAADVISRAAFGSSCYEDGNRIFVLITEQVSLLIPYLKSEHLPGWRFVPTKHNRRMAQIQREIKHLLKNMIDNRLKAMKGAEKSMDDLLGKLLESNKCTQGKKPLSLGDVIEECKVFYFAGQGTTSTLLVWTLILLSKHQDWQERAREEVLSTFGNTAPNFHELNQLKSVNMILQEVLRLYPPFTQIFRNVCEDIKLGDTILPAGVLVRLPLVEVHHDQKLWGADAEEFNPLRFKDGLSKASGGNVSFFSFGWGPRNCIGSNLAMTEAKVALVLILQRFCFRLSSSYVHAPTTMDTVQPQFGAQLVLQLLPK